MNLNELQKKYNILQKENTSLKKKIVSMEGEHDFIRNISENIMEKLYAVMNNSHQSIILFFNRAFEIEDMNTGFQKILGYGEDEFITDIHKSNLKTIRLLLRKHLENEQKGDLFSSDEVEFTKYSGFKCYIQFNISRILNQAGEDRGFIFFGYDLTHKKAMRRNLEVSLKDLELSYREIQQANKYKTEFLNNITHELRTPLSGIIGILKLIYFLKIDNKALDNNLALIENSSRHLLQMINQLLDISRIEAGQMTLSISKIPLGLLVFDAEALAKPLLLEKPQVKFRVEIEHPEHQFFTDQTKLRQVLTNLLGNAIKFTEKGEVVLKIESFEDYISISVKDSGIGIKEEDQDKLFTPFIQADASITKKFGGSGLGLAITKKLVELLKGRISVNSEIGKGSEFIVELTLIKKGKKLS